MVLNNHILEKLEEQFKSKLLKSDEKQLEAFLSSLLKKILLSAVNGDSYNYNQYNNQLNQSIILIDSRINNFSQFYDSVKLKILNEYVKSIIAIDDDFNVFNNTIEDPEMIEFKELYNLSSLKKFEMAVKELKEPLYNFGNDKYNVTVKGDIIIVYNKYSENTRFKDRNVVFELYKGDVNVFKRFVTNDNADDINICKEQLIFNKLKEINFIDDDNFDKNLVSSYYENDNFIVTVSDNDVIINDKVNDGVVNLYYEEIGDYMDFLEFLKYCIGYENIN